MTPMPAKMSMGSVPMKIWSVLPPFLLSSFSSPAFSSYLSSRAHLQLSRISAQHLVASWGQRWSSLARGWVTTLRKCFLVVTNYAKSHHEDFMWSPLHVVAGPRLCQIDALCKKLSVSRRAKWCTKVTAVGTIFWPFRGPFEVNQRTKGAQDK